MRHEGSEVYQGFLARYDLDHNFSVVKVRSFLDVHVGLIKHAVGNLPDSKVVAIGRGTTGNLMAASVVLNGDLSRSDNNEDPVSSRVKITKVHLHYDMCTFMLLFSLNCVLEAMKMFLCTCFISLHFVKFNPCRM